MTEDVRSYTCGCSDGPEEFYLCRKARRLEDRMHNALLDLEGCHSLADDLVQYPITWTDPTYFERPHTIAEHAEKLSSAVAEVRRLAEKARAAGHKEYRARRAVAEHLRQQEADGAYRDEVIEDPPEPDFDQADLY